MKQFIYLFYCIIIISTVYGAINLDDYTAESTPTNGTSIWVNESGVATYYGDAEVKGNITVDNSIKFPTSFIMQNSDGSMNYNGVGP